MFFSIHAAFNDNFQPRDCFNLGNNSTLDLPVPVNLKSSIKGNDFICQDQTPLYTLHCTVYGRDLLWKFNSETVTVFLPDDRVGRFTSNTFLDNKSEIEVYNVTAVLTHASKIVNEDNNAIPVCVSILTVQPFSISQSLFQVIPFTVTCLTHCQDDNQTEVCQSKHYEVAGMLHLF